MTVRQVEGHDSVPAHMTCIQNRICRGLMSIAEPGGHRRVFITVVIDGGNAYLGFRAEDRDLSCSRGQDFMHLALAPSPSSAHAYAFACDDAPPARAPAFQDQAEAPSASKRLLAVLHIELHAVEPGR